MQRFKDRRRNYFINKKFQRNFILKFCSLVVMGAIISGLIIYLMSKSTVTTTFENSRLSIKSTADFILPAVLLASAIVIILTGLVTVAITLFTSHKIAGPLYRMQKDIDEVASGNLTMRFKLRSGDELKALAASLDMMVRNLKAYVSGIKDSLARLEDTLKEAKDSPRGGEVEKAIRELEEAIEKFRI